MADIKSVSRWLLIPTLLLTFGLLAGGCGTGGDDDDDDATTANPPEATPTPYLFFGEIDFSDLEDGDVVRLTLADPQDTGEWTATYVVNFEVSDFTLAPEGECGNEYSCGRAQLLIDGEFNTEVTRPGSIVADFNKVSNPEGNHEFTLKLVFDDGSDAGDPVTISVLVEAPLPSVNIISPNATSNLDYPADGMIEIIYTVGTYKVSDSCNGMLNCGGHKFWLTTQDAPDTILGDYVLEEVGTPGEQGQYSVMFNLDDAGSPSGALLVHAVPVDNDGNEYTDYFGDPIEALSTFNVKEPDAPAIVINSPATGDTVAYGTDGLKTITIEYTLDNFTASYSCNGADHCGEVWAVIAGGADPFAGADVIYNNRSDSSNAIDIYLYYLDYNEAASTGPITVTLQLMTNDGEQVLAGSRPVTATVAFNVEAPDSTNPSIAITFPRSHQTVNLDESKQLDVTFNYDTDNFTLADEGGCGGVSACGRVEAYLNDDEANNAPNAVASSSPITVDFSSLSEEQLYREEGHRIMLRLVYDDGTPVEIDGYPVADWVTVIIRQPQQLPGGGG